MVIIEADNSLKNKVNNFYIEQGYHSDWSESERAFVCLVNEQVVGSVKIELINGFSILRGMYIAPKYQKQGLGTRFLEHIEPILNQTFSYCMPLAHVKTFYEKIGFQAVPMQIYPDFLVSRCNNYREAGYTITTMIRAQAT